MDEQEHNTLERYKNVRFGNVDIAKYLTNAEERDPELDSLIQKVFDEKYKILGQDVVKKFFANKDVKTRLPKIDTSFMSESVYVDNEHGSLNFPKYVPIGLSSDMFRLVFRQEKNKIKLDLGDRNAFFGSNEMMINFCKGFDFFNSTCEFTDIYCSVGFSYGMEISNLRRADTDPIKKYHNISASVIPLAMIPDEINAKANYLIEHDIRNLFYIVSTKDKDWQIDQYYNYSVFDDALLIATRNDVNYLVDHFQFKPLKEELGSMYDDFMKENGEKLIFRDGVQ